MMTRTSDSDISNSATSSREIRDRQVTNLRTGELTDTKLDVKIVLSGLWISMLMVFAYVDIFGFFRADMIKGALAGKLPVVGFAINQRFLVLTTIYILIPSLMVVVALVAPARMNRISNIVIAALYTASILVGMGDPWKYYVLGSAVEVVLLIVIIRVSVKWPRNG
jgi:Family of unknown function (DUF6326)